MRAADLLLAALLSAPPAIADSEIERYLGEVSRAQAKVSTLRARFAQEKHVAILHDALRSSGIFTLERRGRIVWDVTEPERVRIVISPEGVFVGGQRMAGEAPSGISPLPMLERFTEIFAGLSEATTRDFEVTRVDRDRLRLVPRSAALRNWIQALEITLEPERKIPVHIRLEEPGGDTAEIRFSDLSLNPKLEEGAFTP
jgi:outer membrane lipoprotein-sorting protein